MKRKEQNAGLSFRRLLLIAVWLVFSCSELALAEPDDKLIDCPLRDARYSANLPLIDILLKPEAKTLLNVELEKRNKTLPKDLRSVEPPSFTTFVTLHELTNILKLDNEFVQSMNKGLAKLSLNDADRSARCARYDNDRPEFKLDEQGKKVLIFHKINGFDHGPSVDMATAAITELTRELNWQVAVTDKGGAFTPELLSQFDVVVWNNVSGDVLTLSQRKAFEGYMHNGGGFIGIHGSGGDSIYFWDWYVNTLIGAQFIGHPGNPQFQTADVVVETHPSGIASSLSEGFELEDEWYSFEESARLNGASIVARLDENSYSPKGWHGEDISMGDDHPIVWTRCVGKGRSFYSAIGHRPGLYFSTANLILLKDAMRWAAGEGDNRCDKND